MQPLIYNLIDTPSTSSWTSLRPRANISSTTSWTSPLQCEDVYSLSKLSFLTISRPHLANRSWSAATLQKSTLRPRESSLHLREHSRYDLANILFATSPTLSLRPREHSLYCLANIIPATSRTSYLRPREHHICDLTNIFTTSRTSYLRRRYP